MNCYLYFSAYAAQMILRRDPKCFFTSFFTFAVWSHLLEKSFMENLIICAVITAYGSVFFRKFFHYTDLTSNP